VQEVVRVQVGDHHGVELGGIDDLLQRPEGTGAEVHQHPPGATGGVLVLDEVAGGRAAGAGETAAAADDTDPHAGTTGSVEVMVTVGPRKRRERSAKSSLSGPTAVWA